MYRRRSGGSGLTFLLVIVLGIVAGTVFLFNEGIIMLPSQASLNPEPPAAAAAPEDQPTAVTAVAAAATPFRLPDYKIFIPTIGVYAPIVQLQMEGTSWNVANLGAAYVGHLHNTTPLGEEGNSILVGHVEMPDGNGGVFRLLENVAIGDPVVIEVENQERRYRVVDIRSVAPDDLSVLYPTDHEQLTLITCDDYNFITGLYQTRVAVVAERVA